MIHIELRSGTIWTNHVTENVSYGRKCLLQPKMVIFGPKTLMAKISVTAEFRGRLLRLQCFGKKSLSVTH